MADTEDLEKKKLRKKLLKRALEKNTSAPVKGKVHLGDAYDDWAELRRRMGGNSASVAKHLLEIHHKYCREKHGDEEQAQSSAPEERERESREAGERIDDAVPSNGVDKPLCIKVSHLPVRSSDSSLRDGLFHEYKKFGKVASVTVFGEGEDRNAVVLFKTPADAQAAMDASADKHFFGSKIQVEPHDGGGIDMTVLEQTNEYKPIDSDLNEFHPKATRSLFIGNLEKSVTAEDLRKLFEEFGEIIEIDVKAQGAVTTYAFVQYADISSVVKAMRKMDGQHIGNNIIKLGFGKSMPTNCVWINRVNTEIVSEKTLYRLFARFGPVTHCVIDTIEGKALIYFENLTFAQIAVDKMRGWILAGTKIHIDFASRDCQTAFFEKMELTGQLRPGERPDERGGRFAMGSTSTLSSFSSAPFSGPGFSDSGFGRGNYSRGGMMRGSYSPRGRGMDYARGTLPPRGAPHSSFGPSSRSGRYSEFDDFASAKPSTLDDFGTPMDWTTPLGEESTFLTGGGSSSSAFRSASYERDLREYQQRYDSRRSPSPQFMTARPRAPSPTMMGSSRSSSRYSAEYLDQYGYPPMTESELERKGYRAASSSDVRQSSRPSKVFRDLPFDERFPPSKRVAYSPPPQDAYGRGHKEAYGPKPGYRSRSVSPVGQEDKRERSAHSAQKSYRGPATPPTPEAQFSRESSPDHESNYEYYKKAVREMRKKQQAMDREDRKSSQRERTSSERSSSRAYRIAQASYNSSSYGRYSPNSSGTAAVSEKSKHYSNDNVPSAYKQQLDEYEMQQQQQEQQQHSRRRRNSSLPKAYRDPSP